MRMHGDHPATCLCCKHLVLGDADHGYSDVTPGNGATIVCLKGYFNHDEFDMTAAMEAVMSRAAECEDYEGRE